MVTANPVSFARTITAPASALPERRASVGRSNASTASIRANAGLRRVPAVLSVGAASHATLSRERERAPREKSAFEISAACSRSNHATRVVQRARMDALRTIPSAAARNSVSAEPTVSAHPTARTPPPRTPVTAAAAIVPESARRGASAAAPKTCIAKPAPSASPIRLVRERAGPAMFVRTKRSGRRSAARPTLRAVLPVRSARRAAKTASVVSTQTVARAAERAAGASDVTMLRANVRRQRQTRR
jgi:hypothetical protein